MKEHLMKLNVKQFNLIKIGTKKIEARLFDDKRSKLKVGDNIVFTNLNDENEKIKVRVVNLHRFEFLRHYLRLFLQRI